MHLTCIQKFYWFGKILFRGRCSDRILFMAFMKYTFLFTILFALNFKAFPQTSSTVLSVYYKLINNAEMCIVRGHIDSAINFYKKIEKRNTRLRYKDLYNISVCFALLNDTINVVKRLKKLIQYGAKLKWLEANKSLAPFITNVVKQKFLYEENRFARKKNYLRDTLKIIFQNDQEPRKIINAYNKNIKTIKSNDSLNANIIDRIIGRYKIIPGEDALGINDSSFIWQPFYIFFVHQTITFQVHDYSAIVLSSLKKGTLNPQIGAYLYFRTAGSLYGFGPITLLKILWLSDSIQKDIFQNSKFRDEYESKFPWLIPAISDSVIARYDSIRENIGLDPIKDFYVKAKFQLTNNQFKFYYSPFIYTIFNCSTEKDAEVLRRGYVELK